MATTKTMQAAVRETRCCGCEYGEMPVPNPGAGEVRVKIHASGVNLPIPIRSGWGGIMMSSARVIPHNDGAGAIDKGEGVPTSRIGERVWLYETQRQRGFGTAAGFAVVPSDHAVYSPENTNFAEAACWGSRDDSSPLRLCRRFCAGTNYFSDGWSGCRRLPCPATGEMGGATIATVSRSEQAELVKAAGADHHQLQNRRCGGAN